MRLIHFNWMLLFGLFLIFHHLNALSVEHQRRFKREETTKAPFVCPGDGKWPDDTDCGK